MGGLSCGATTKTWNFVARGDTHTHTLGYRGMHRRRLLAAVAGKVGRKRNDITSSSSDTAAPGRDGISPQPPPHTFPSQREGIMHGTHVKILLTFWSFLWGGGEKTGAGMHGAGIEDRGNFWAMHDRGRDETSSPFASGPFKMAPQEAAEGIRWSR